MSRSIPWGVLVLLVATAAQGGVFMDDFGAGVRPQYWTVEHSNPGFYTFDDSLGDIRFAKIGTNPQSIQSVGARLRLSAFSATGSLSGDLDIQVQFSDAILPGLGADQVELQAKFANGYYFFNVRQHGDGRNDVHVWEGIGGTQAQGQINTTADAGALRITRTGQTLAAYLDGVEVWHNASATTSDLSSLTFSLQNNLYSDDNTSVIFDNFRIENAAVPVPGDADLDGKIDGGDLAIWCQNYDPLRGYGNNTFAMGDFNWDGKIDGGDLALWQINYAPMGYNGASPAPATAVPEPLTLWLLGTGALALIGAGRRRQTV